VLLAATDELLVAKVATPGKVELIARHTCPVPCERALVWKDQAVAGGPKGLAAVDLTSGTARHFCSTPLGLRWAFAVAQGSVFLQDGGNLLVAPIPASTQR
jgi:hypothetical protein